MKRPKGRFIIYYLAEAQAAIEDSQVVSHQNIFIYKTIT